MRGWQTRDVKAIFADDGTLSDHCRTHDGGRDPAMAGTTHDPDWVVHVLRLFEIDAGEVCVALLLGPGAAFAFAATVAPTLSDLSGFRGAAVAQAPDVLDAHVPGAGDGGPAS
ncbi:MAG: hypothetical protein NXI16_06880 [Alphaproteobacteria bacterium]|nr:hypothetical protein [Alphaproteobacteria bacterium]